MYTVIATLYMYMYIQLLWNDSRFHLNYMHTLEQREGDMCTWRRLRRARTWCLRGLDQYSRFDEFLDGLDRRLVGGLLQPLIHRVFRLALDLQDLASLVARQRLAAVLERQRDVTVTQRVVVALVCRQRRVLLDSDIKANKEQTSYKK